MNIESTRESNLEKVRTINEIPGYNPECYAIPYTDLHTGEIRCDHVNFMSIPDLLPGEEISSSVRIRYHHAGTPAVLRRSGEDEITVSFEQPVRAATPGQSAVFYDEQGCIIGGGRIL